MNYRAQYLIIASSLLLLGCAAASVAPRGSADPAVKLEWLVENAWNENATVMVTRDASNQGIVISGLLPAPTTCGTLSAVAHLDDQNELLVALTRQAPGAGYGCLAIAGSYKFSATVQIPATARYHVRVHYVYYREDHSAQIDRWVADTIVGT